MGRTTYQASTFAHKLYATSITARGKPLHQMSAPVTFTSGVIGNATTRNLTVAVCIKWTSLQAITSGISTSLAWPLHSMLPQLYLSLLVDIHCSSPIVEYGSFTIVLAHTIYTARTKKAGAAGELCFVWPLCFFRGPLIVRKTRDNNVPIVPAVHRTHRYGVVKKNINAPP